MVHLDSSTETKAAELATGLDESLDNRTIQVRSQKDFCNKYSFTSVVLVSRAHFPISYSFIRLASKSWTVFGAEPLGTVKSLLNHIETAATGFSPTH